MQQESQVRRSSEHVADSGDLWNDDPRLQDVLPPALLPEAVGVTELSSFLHSRSLYPYLKNCAALLHDELARHNAQTLEEGAWDIMRRADLLLHRQRIGPRGKVTEPCDETTARALLLRYGLLGDAPATLDTFGKLIGRTRERARQIQNRHDHILRSTRPSWPQLDRALAVALRMAPCRESELADELIRLGIASIPYSVDSLRASAAFAGRRFDLHCVDGVLGLSSPEVTAVTRSARKLASRQGLASLLQISDDLVDDGFVMAEDEICACLTSSASVVWLDEDHVTWETGRNRLTNTLRLMLSVHQPVPLSTAQNGVVGYYSYRNSGRTADQPDLTPPSLEALRAFCKWHPDFDVGHDDLEHVVSRVTLDHTQELGLEAAMLVEVIRSIPEQAADRITLLEAAEAVGMKSGTVSVYLTFHPAFVSLARNVWTVLGTDVSSDTIEAIRSQAKQRSRNEARDFVPSAEGDRPWVAFAVTSNIRMSGVLLRRWLPADTSSLRLPLTDDRGNGCGTAVYNASSGFTHGLGSYIRRFDVRVGECILLTADLDWEIAHITHGSRQLLKGPILDS